MDSITRYLSPLGPLTLASDGSSLVGLWFEGQRYYAKSLMGEAEEKNLPIFEETKKWLDAYFAGMKPAERPPLEMRGTPFQKQVWEILETIPYGTTMTYGEIAHQLVGKMNRPMSAQAVGGAVAHNPISILIPCHRVVGANGCLTGYAGGLSRKEQLLALERQQ